MAHNIFFNEQTGAHSFFSVKQQAWHGLGQVVSDHPTSAEAMAYAGLDYEVLKLPNRQLLPNGEMRVSETSFFTYRDDNNIVLGDRLGKDYEIVQNRDAFSFFDSIVADSMDVKYETAGALGLGERIFITAKLPGNIRVGNGDDVTNKFLFLYTSHDGTASITAAFTPVRVVCYNTLNAALANMQNVIRIRHTSGAAARLENAHRIMGMTNIMADQLAEVFNHWAKVRITDRQVKRLIDMAMASRETLDHLIKGRTEMLPTAYQKKCDRVFEYGMASETQQLETTKGTLFGAYNAVTGYFQNVAKYEDAECKMKSILFGGNAQNRGQTAFDLCAQFAQDGPDCLLMN